MSTEVREVAVLPVQLSTDNKKHFIESHRKSS